MSLMRFLTLCIEIYTYFVLLTYMRNISLIFGQLISFTHMFEKCTVLLFSAVGLEGITCPLWESVSALDSPPGTTGSSGVTSVSSQVSTPIHLQVSASIHHQVSTEDCSLKKNKNKMNGATF